MTAETCQAKSCAGYGKPLVRVKEYNRLTCPEAARSCGYTIIDSEAPTTSGYTLPKASGARKEIPLYSGVVAYFPAALAGVARVSKVGNDKHNPGQPLHHARGKSADHADCIARHLVDMGEGSGRDDNGIPEVDYLAWRALALAQEWHEKHDGAPLAPGAVEPPKKPSGSDGDWV